MLAVHSAARKGFKGASPTCGGPEREDRAIISNDKNRGDPLGPTVELSGREQQVLLTWLKSDTKAETAKQLSIAEGTVNTYIQRVRRKFESKGYKTRTKTDLFISALLDRRCSLDDFD